jgi:hypothetical protein
MRIEDSVSSQKAREGAGCGFRTFLASFDRSAPPFCQEHCRNREFSSELSFGVKV